MFSHLVTLTYSTYRVVARRKICTRFPPNQVPLGFDNVAAVVTAERPPQQPGRRSFVKKAEEDLESVDSFWGVGTATVTGDTPAGKSQPNWTPGYVRRWGDAMRGRYVYHRFEIYIFFSVNIKVCPSVREFVRYPFSSRAENRGFSAGGPQKSHLVQK